MAEAAAARAQESTRSARPAKPATRCATSSRTTPAGRQGRLRWDHVVVLPNAEIPDDFALPECPRWKVIDRNDLPKLVDKLRHVLVRQELDRPLLTQEGIDQLSTALSGRGLPQRDVVARALANEDAADALTEHQAVILDAIRLLNRVEVRGGAGSGKTFLAMEQARRLAAARASASRWSATPTAWPPTWSASPPPGRAANGPPTSASSTPSACCGAHPKGPTNRSALTRPCSSGSTTSRCKWPTSQRNSSPATGSTPIVVDEAQDFADAWWDPLLAALKDDETGGIYVFTDEGQRVFNRYGSPPVPLVPLILDHNLRNTRQIANAFQPLVDHPMRFLGGEGPAVKFVACAREDAMDAGDDQVELLLEEGWRPEDVALLTTGTRHPEQNERQAAGSAAYWDSFWDADQVFYGHVLGFKGLERRAVVLVVNEESAFERSRERLYVGLSRARDQLVVCGDPDFIREVGGPDLAHRLNLPSG